MFPDQTTATSIILRVNAIQHSHITGLRIIISTFGNRRLCGGPPKIFLLVNINIICLCVFVIRNIIIKQKQPHMSRDHKWRRLMILNLQRNQRSLLAVPASWSQEQVDLLYHAIDTKESHQAKDIRRAINLIVYYYYLVD